MIANKQCESEMGMCGVYDDEFETIKFEQHLSCTLLLDRSEMEKE